jgi:hypothetical protein
LVTLMTTLTMRMIKGDFVVTGPDVEPMRFKSRAEARDWCKTQSGFAHYWGWSRRQTRSHETGSEEGIASSGVTHP